MKKIIITMSVLAVVGLVGYTVTKNTLEGTSLLAAQAFNPEKNKLALAVNSMNPKNVNANANGKANSNGNGNSQAAMSSRSGGSGFVPAQYINPKDVASVNGFTYYKKSKDYTGFNFNNICNASTTSAEQCKAAAETLFVIPEPTAAIPNPVIGDEYKISWQDVFTAGNCVLFKKNIRDSKVAIETARYNLSVSKNSKTKISLAKTIETQSVKFNNNIKFLRSCLIAADKLAK